jgi:hypothetical protein
MIAVQHGSIAVSPNCNVLVSIQWLSLNCTNAERQRLCFINTKSRGAVGGEVHVGARRQGPQSDRFPAGCQLYGHRRIDTTGPGN